MSGPLQAARLARWGLLSAVLALLPDRAVAEYEILAVGLSTWELPAASLAASSRIDLVDPVPSVRTDPVLEICLDRPLWGPLAWLWVGGDWRRATGEMGSFDVSARRWRLRLGVTEDAVEWVVSLGVAAGSQRWSLHDGSGARRTWKRTTGVHAALHRKVWADLGLFAGVAHEWQDVVTLGDWVYADASGWRVRAGLSWQMPMAWLELL